MTQYKMTAKYINGGDYEDTVNYSELSDRLRWAEFTEDDFNLADGTWTRKDQEAQTFEREGQYLDPHTIKIETIEE